MTALAGSSFFLKYIIEQSVIENISAQSAKLPPKTGALLARSLAPVVNLVPFGALYNPVDCDTLKKIHNRATEAAHGKPTAYIIEHPSWTWLFSVAHFIMRLLLINKLMPTTVLSIYVSIIGMLFLYYHLSLCKAK